METSVPKPVIVVSACLGFRSCRYNGQSLPHPLVERLRKFVEFRPVCPEVEIGLGVPRDPIRIVEQGGAKLLVQPATGREVSTEMKTFTDGFLSALGPIDGFILKNRSPSCGIGDVKIYQGTDPGASSTRGPGLFGEEILARFPGYPIEDEGRLNNFTLREHFLAQLYALTEFRRVREGPSIQALIAYHTRQKMQLLGYNQARSRELGRVVAAYKRGDLAPTLSEYETHLRQALAKPPRYTSIINVLLHAMGGLSKGLTPQERQFFLNTVEEYRDERVPLSVPARLLEAWALRLDKRYLLGQSFLTPYPRALTDITDSGKGRKL
ncbi:MAG: DUF1722 domain-containing protein [Spirochaetales bacterium]|nr:DUF1722 domain-containing protein [Spirochaetales bacterium]